MKMGATVPKLKDSLKNYRTKKKNYSVSKPYNKQFGNLLVWLEVSLINKF